MKIESKASTTDPESTVMRFTAGYFAGGYNVQIGVAKAKEGERTTIVSIHIAQSSSDQENLVKVYDKITGNQNGVIQKVICDKGYAQKNEIEELEKRCVEVIMPIPKKWKKEETKKDSEEIKRWKRRMKKEETKKEYKSRGKVSERVNSEIKRKMGLREIHIRGKEKVEALFSLAASVRNLWEHRFSLFPFLI